MTDLSGQVALVTGAGRGLGAATALVLADAGAAVALLGRTAAPLAAIAGQISARGHQAAYAVADAARWDDVRAAVTQTSAALGPISILVNNAAVNSAVARVATLDPAAWTYDLAANLNGPFYAVRAVLPGMLERGWGRILNISSGAAVGANAGLAAYSTAKAGLNHFTRVLAAELEDTGVVALCIAPGIMDTQMQTDARALAIPETDMFRAYQKQGWLRPPAEAAALVRWLCGSEGGEFAGQFVSIHSTALRARVGLPELPEALRQP
jgi:NAD(P)-dependent dehydrogenase (short-subunit alcohol dehydrogenase family)